MRLLFLTSLTMVAFAANSVLNRMALAGGEMDAVAFASVRLISGAVILAVLTFALRGRLNVGGWNTVFGVAALLIYLYGFSLAYNALDAGIGALILFGVVQITMFAGAALKREPLPRQRWVGAALALAGLCWLLWPGEAANISMKHGLLMALAGVGWGLYSLVGRDTKDALMSTTANFVLASPVAIIALVLLPNGISISQVETTGIALAVMSGAITSGLGYALWYSVLPKLQAASAAVSQLSVPVIAMAGGMLFLDETLGLRFALASVLVMAGVAISILRP